MNILLINPPAKHLVRTFAPDSLTEEMGFYPPMGLLYIAAAAQKQHDGQLRIEVLDTQVEELGYEEIENVLAQKRPDMVGISCMTFLLVDALKVARLVKKMNPAAHVTFGGTHPTIYPREMAAQPEVDSIVIGEGEFTFSELVTAVANGGSLGGIKGLGFRRNGEVVINPPREFIQDLDSLPFPDRTLLPWKKYYCLLGKGIEIMTSLLTSRGCPFDCVFCTKKDGRTCRMRSPENVLQEIEECVALGITDFDIIDDTFTIHRQRVMEIADRIIAGKLGITMDLRARVDTVDQEMLDRLAEAGCNRVRFGVESGNPGVLKNLKKGITLDQIRSAYKMAKKAGIVTFAYFMLGSPGETEKEIKESIVLAKELNPDFAQFLITTPFPETELYEIGRKNGILKGDFWRDFSANPRGEFTAQWWTENFTQKELEKWQRKAHLSYYYRPKYIWGQLRQVKSFTEFARKAKIALRLFFG